MNAKAALLILGLLASCPLISNCRQGNEHEISATSGIASKERVQEMLVRPSCLESFSPAAKSYDKEDVIIPSDGIELRGKLYLPKEPGLHPAIIYMHGGGNDYDLLMSAPLYYAPRLATCGYATLIYDERGTGESGGVFYESIYDDFISDAGHAADFLAKHEQIDPGKIGVFGGSQGGRLAPVVAVRFASVSFAISTSGPIGNVADQATFNMRYALKVRGYADTTIQQVMPIRERQHAAWESQDTAELNEVAAEIMKMRKFIDPLALPNTRQEFLTDSSLFFLRPMYFSMPKDYMGELAKLDLPWLALYGELDSVINVRETIANIQKQMAAAKNQDYEIFMIDHVDHSFLNNDTQRYVPVVNIIVNWLSENISN